MPANPLSGRVAIVTGANHGIGAAIAQRLARRGANVLVTYLRYTGDSTRTDLPATYHEQRSRDGSEVCAAVEALGAKALAVETDLTAPDSPKLLFDTAEAELGAVSVLVHNASGWKRDSFATSRDHIDRPGFAVNVDSVTTQLFVDARAGALLMAEFIARHRARRDTWGRIVTMTSGTGGGGYPGQVSYGAAKSALISYTLSAASEMARDGVCANVVYPPVTDTGWVTDAVRHFVAHDSDHHYIATPDEVADTVEWLCADANHLVNGNVIRLR